MTSFVKLPDIEENSAVTTSVEQEKISENINFWSKMKTVLMIFLVFIIVSTDVFIDQILSRFNGAVGLNIPTTYGTVIQGVFIVVGYVIFDILINYSIL